MAQPIQLLAQAAQQAGQAAATAAGQAAGTVPADPNAAATAATAAELAHNSGILNFIVFAFKAGGAFMWPIAFVGTWALVVTVDRTMRYMAYSIDAEGFFAKIQKFVLEDSVDRAINLCNGKSGSLLPEVLKSGLMKAGGSESEIQNAIDEGTLEAQGLVEKRGLYLPMIANISTLSGLLGTVSGLIQAFASIGQTAPDQRASALAAAIAEAMNCTAFGLLVAIPATVVHTVLQSRANKVMADIDHYGIKLINLLLASKRK